MGHHDDEIPGIECFKRKLFANQIKENGGAHSMAATVFLILSRRNSAGRFIGQVHSEYLSCVSTCHCRPSHSFALGFGFGLNIIGFCFACSAIARFFFLNKSK
jgi:hypothetical protein